LKANDTVAILSALWFYQKRVLNNNTVDSGTSVKKITKKVNGGINGLADREIRFLQAKDSINCL
jgi:predicted chitinase